MTDTGYFVGQVADLLGGGKKSKKLSRKSDKLVSLFEVKNNDMDNKQSGVKPKKKKKGAVKDNSQTNVASKKKKKVAVKDNSQMHVQPKQKTKESAVKDNSQTHVKPKQKKKESAVKDNSQTHVKPKQKKKDNGEKDHQNISKKDKIKKEKKMKNEASSPKKPKKKSKKTPESGQQVEQKTKDNDGFCPPNGIVHESLTQNSDHSADKNSRKRKHEEDGSDEEKEVKRKRKKRDKTKDRRTVFVGNLPLDCKKATVKSMFAEFGKIESIRYRCPPVADPNVPKKVTVIKKEFHPGRSNIVSFVCFEDVSSAGKALKLNGHNMNGFHLRVDIASNEKKHNQSNSVFIGNIPFDIEENEIWGHFEDCGEIENVRVVRDRKTGVGKGFGYVLFKERFSVDLAQKLQESTLKGRQIRVDMCGDSKKIAAKKEKSKLHPAHQRLMKKAKKIGLKPTNQRPGEKRKTFKKKDKSTKSKIKKSVDKVFSAPPQMPSKNKHIKFD